MEGPPDARSGLEAFTGRLTGLESTKDAARDHLHEIVLLLEKTSEVTLDEISVGTVLLKLVGGVHLLADVNAVLHCLWRRFDAKFVHDVQGVDNQGGSHPFRLFLEMFRDFRTGPGHRPVGFEFLRERCREGFIVSHIAFYLEAIGRQVRPARVDAIAGWKSFEYSHALKER